MKIALGSDHAGFDLKELIKKYLLEKSIDIEDKGADSPESVDYPDYGFKVAESVSLGNCSKGILVCGSGIGMSIIANKVKNIRAALCMNPEQAALSRQHNDSNVLVLAGRMTDTKTGLEILINWLDTDFEGGRHDRRVKKIHELSGC